MLLRKLPHIGDRRQVELSGRILAGGSHEDVTFYGKSDRRHPEGGRFRITSQRDLTQARYQFSNLLQVEIEVQRAGCVRACTGQGAGIGEQSA